MSVEKLLAGIAGIALGVAIMILTAYLHELWSQWRFKRYERLRQDMEFEAALRRFEEPR